nr:MAG TPA: hypothetical protein [Caudoviricetes sp.]
MQKIICLSKLWTFSRISFISLSTLLSFISLISPFSL